MGGGDTAGHPLRVLLDKLTSPRRALSTPHPRPCLAHTLSRAKSSRGTSSFTAAASRSAPTTTRLCEYTDAYTSMHHTAVLTKLRAIRLYSKRSLLPHSLLIESSLSSPSRPSHSSPPSPYYPFNFAGSITAAVGTATSSGTS